MEQERFDQLAVSMARGAHRRTLLQFLSGALIGAGLLAAPDVAGKGKRKHKGKGKGKSPKAKRRQQRDKRKGKQTKAAACPLCKRLNAQGRCVVDHAVNGQCCTRAGGQSGQCLNGTCWPGQCSGPICTDQTCPDGCCDTQGSCHIDDDNACGTGGGSCTSCTALGTTCGGGGTPGVCGLGTCTPRTCAQNNCGPMADGCGGLVQCGPCATGHVCGGGGTPSVCGSGTCTPRTCAAQGIQCGPAGDGCGGTINCGTCTAPQTCGGGGIPNVCGGCSADNCAEGCCDGVTCRVGDAAACGTDGGTCVDCRAVDFCDPGPCGGLVCVSPCDCVAGRGCCLAAGNRPPDAGALGCLAFCCAGVCTGPADDPVCA